jgi:malate synthase
VAHPDLVPVCDEEFSAVLGERPNQLDRQRDDVAVTAADLLNVAGTPAECTEDGLRNDVSVGIQYIESWLRGTGAAGINNMMEDAATAEIARSQVWQWRHAGTQLSGGRKVTEELVRSVIDEELGKIRDALGEQTYTEGRWEQAREVFEQVALADDFVDFLTLPAYQLID